MQAGRGALGALALVLFAPAVAGAAEPTPFHGRPPVLSVTLSPAPTTGSDEWDVFLLSEGAATATRPRFALRDMRFIDGRLRLTQWADSATCPALLDSLRAVGDIQVRFTPPYPIDQPAKHGLRIPQTPWPVDGDYVEVRGEGIAVGGRGRAHVSVFSNEGPWVTWAVSAERALKTCWSGTEPAVTTGG